MGGGWSPTQCASGFLACLLSCSFAKQSLTLSAASAGLELGSGQCAVPQASGLNTRIIMTS